MSEHTTFNPDDHMITVQGGKDYLPVAWRLVWMRSEHPDWQVETKPIEINIEKGYAIFTAAIRDGEGKLLGTGTKHENVRGFQDYIEKSETGSVGRALAVCGYGTQFAPDLDEGQERIVDAPQDRKGRKGSAAPLVCSHPGCGSVLTQGQYDYSTRTFNKPLCPDHQKAAKDGSDDKLICADCGQVIVDAKCGDRELKAQQIADLSESKFGKKYCAACSNHHAHEAAKAKDAAEKASAANKQ
jgi:hypothetical protein